jgi:hypothetical protein
MAYKVTDLLRDVNMMKNLCIQMEEIIANSEKNQTEVFVDTKKYAALDIYSFVKITERLAGARNMFKNKR